MKRILILIIGLIGVAYGQYSATSAKTRFVNGLALGTKLDSYFNAADSNAIYWRADSVVMAKYKGTARALAFAVSGGYIPYSDTTTLLSQVVRTFGTQTVGGNKTFSNDIVVNGLTVGRGSGSISSNTAFGLSALNVNTIGSQNVANGTSALISNTSGSANTAVGNSSMFSNILGSNNTAIGRSSLISVRGSGNTAVGSGAGTIITSGSNSTYIGFSAVASDTGVSNETVIGYNATGNGSNTVTIGNSSVVGNYFNGFLKQTSVTSALVKASATGQFEAAVAGTDYVAGSSLSGTTNYIPKFTSSTAIGNSILQEGSSSIGISVTPSVWATVTPALEFTAGGFIASQGSANTLYMGSNHYYNGTNFIRKQIGHAMQYQVGADVGAFVWKGAASGSAGSTISFTDLLTLNSTALTSTVPISGTSLSMSGATQLATSSGNVLIKTTTDNGTDALQVAGSGRFTSSIQATANASGRSGLFGGATYGVRIDNSGSFNNGGSTIHGVDNTFVASYQKLSLNGSSLEFMTDYATRFTISNSGAATFSSSVTASSIIKSGGTSTQALIADGSVQTLTSGTYTPTLTNTQNISSSTASVSSYTRIGNIVTVYAVASATTSAAGQAELTFSVPIATTAANAVVVGSGIDSIRFPINNGSSGTTVGVRWTATSGTATNINVIFQYTVN